MSANTFEAARRLPAGESAPVNTFALERHARALQTVHVGNALGSAGRAVVRGFTTLGLHLRALLERRQALAHLNQLDDRLLADIGLSRGNLLGQLLEAEAVRAAPQSTVAPIVTTPANTAQAANANRQARAA